MEEILLAKDYINDIKVHSDIRDYKKELKNSDGEMQSILRANFSRTNMLSTIGQEYNLSKIEKEHNINNALNNLEYIFETTRGNVEPKMDEVIEKVKILEELEEVDYNEFFHATKFVVGVAISVAVSSCGVYAPVGALGLKAVDCQVFSRQKILF